MKIVSPFKDYYDYVSTIFGIDNKITYLRGYIPEEGYSTRYHFYCDDHSLRVPLDVHPSFFPSSNRRDYHFRFLVIAGRRYLLIKVQQPFSCNVNHQMIGEPQPWQLFDPDLHDDVFEKPSKISRLFAGYQPMRQKLGYYLGKKEDETLIKLSKKIHQPVFLIDHVEYSSNAVERFFVHVNRRIPRLSELGVPAIIDAQKIYQDIEYYLGNILNESPDIKPPAEVSNDDLIVAKGFDLKKSFRKERRKKR